MVEYKETNECVEAILLGLDVKPYDKVFAICGSGEQSLALLSRAESVFSVDYHIDQLEYAKRRANDIVIIYKNSKHLRDRIEKIINKLDKINFECLDMRDVNYSNFTKVYLSNTLTYSTNICYSTQFLNKLLEELPSDSLVYFSCDRTSEYIRDSNKHNKNKHRFYFDAKLTNKARKQQKSCYHGITWLPLVYRVLPKNIEFV